MAKTPKNEAADKAPEGTASYVAQWHVKRDGRLVEPGETLELTEAEAQQLGAAVKAAE